MHTSDLTTYLLYEEHGEARTANPLPAPGFTPAFCILLVIVMCLVCQMLPVSLNCQLWVDSSVLLVHLYRILSLTRAMTKKTLGTTH